MTTTAITETSTDYARFVLQQMQLSGCCARFERACSNALGMQITGRPYAACVAGRRAVREAVDATIIKNGHLNWLDTQSTASNLQAIASSNDYPDLQIALDLESFPSPVTPASANAYVDRCLHFALETVGIRRLGVPTGPRFSDEGREPRYNFVRQWGTESLAMGIQPTKYPTQLLIATIRGGRSAKVTPTISSNS